MGNEFFRSDNLKNLITLPSWYLTSLPLLYSSGSCENSHPGEHMDKGGLCSLQNPNIGSDYMESLL